MDEAKRQFVAAWLTRAGQDLGAARVLAQAPEPYFGVALYHCQQAAEKAVKGFLVFHDQRPQKTHDIRKLVDTALSVEGGFFAWLTVAEQLTPYATKFRYVDDLVGAEPSREEFDAMFNAASKFYQFILSTLPSETHP